MREILVAHVMSSPVVTLHRNESLPGAGATMRERRIRHLPVVDDDGRLVGLVTHRDVLAAQIGGETPLSDDQRGEVQLSVPVEHIMRRNVWTVRPQQRAVDVARLLYDLQFGCAPVVDDQMRVVGIITEADFLQMAIELLDGERHVLISDLMTRDVITVDPDDELTVADVLMKLERVRHLPVVEPEGRLVGLLSHRDLLKARRSTLTQAPHYSHNARARDFMASEVTTVAADDSASAAARQLVDNKYGCLPVLDGDKLVGIVCEADFLAAVVARLSRVKRQPDHDAPVNYYMTEPAITVRVDDDLVSVRDVLARHQVTGVAVVDDDGILRGAISRTDLARVRERGPGGGFRLPAGTVSMAMSRGVFTARADQRVATAAATMLRKGVHRLFVVDNDHRPVGVLTTSDIMLAVRDFRLDAPISVYASTPIFTSTVSDTLDRVNELLELAQLSGVIVRDGPWPVGFFSHDELLAARDMPGDTQIEHVMSAALTCVPHDMPLHRVAAQAAALHVRRVLVMQSGQIEGVVTGIDFARALAAAG